jgi:hypothetical protein
MVAVTRDPMTDVVIPFRAALEPGTAVEVRNRFDRRWGRGFEIGEVTAEGYRILRLSDGSELPELFGRDEVRRQRDREGFWWH